MRPGESFINQPIRSLQTMLRVIAENDPSHPSLVPDGIYGPETVQAVSFFQRRHGLAVTGVTDQPTWEAITAVYEPALTEQAEAYPLQIILNPGQVIRKGERHPNVYIIQGILAVLAETYDSIPKPGLTGILDDATVDALAAFQMLNRHSSTGNLDKTTWKLLALHFPLAASLQTKH